MAPRFHGRHQLNRHPDGLEKCVGCELCAWACPADAIYVEGAANTDEERFRPASATAASTRSTTCAAFSAGCASRPPDPGVDHDARVRAGRDDNRLDLIYEKDELLAPLLPGMVAPPHPMVEGADETDYYLGRVTLADASQMAEAAARQEESTA